MKNRSLVAAAVMAFAFAPLAPAEVVEFTIDPARSSLTLTSTTLFAGVPLETTPQAPGADTAPCSGTLHVDLATDAIQLLAGSVLVVNDSGAWLPGTDYSNYPADLNSPTGYTHTPVPANFGIVTDLTPLGNVLGTQGMSPSCTRYVEMSLQDTAPKPIACGVFDESGTAVDFTSGTIYYSSGGSPPITDMVNTINPQDTIDLAEPALLANVGTTQTLTIPFSSLTTFFINFLVVQYQLEGVIVATRDVSAEVTPGDFDDDGDVDGADLAFFADCLAGPELDPPTCACHIADLTGDYDVDLLDFARWQEYHAAAE